MSAFLCGKDHIDLLVSYCADGWCHEDKWISLSNVMRVDVGRTLISENIKSLRYRYRDAGPDWWATDDEWYNKYEFVPVTETVSPEQIVKACDCLAYQSCEHPEWGSSEAHAIVAATRARHVHKMLSRDPDLFWEWHREALLSA